MTHQAELLKAEAIAARRAARAPWQNAHVDRINREREARRISKEYRQAQDQSAKPTKHCNGCNRALPLDAFGPHKRQGMQSRCRPCSANAARASYYRKLGRAETGRARGTIDPERRREAAERISQLTALLMGTSVGQRITSEQGWDVATRELRQLWLESGDKVCIECKAVVPPSAMLPPGPANFYPGKCRSCAVAQSRAHSERVFGPYKDPDPILLRDGSTITLAEFARRHRERELGRPHQTTGADHHNRQPTLCALG